MDIQIINENGEKKTHHIPEMETIVGCSCCGHIFRARDTKATMVRSQHVEKWIRIWNPNYISPTEYLVADEDGVRKVSVKETIHWDKEGKVPPTLETEPNPVPKYKWKKVDSKRVEYTCMDCLSKPITAAVKDMKIVPTSTLEIADQVRTWREAYGARLVMLGFGRPVDAIVEMVCQKLKVKFQEAHV